MADIRQLRYLIAVLERGSVSRAAVELHLSQSSLSQALRGLESELGVQLLVRSSRGVTATAAGAALLPEASEAVAQFDRALEVARGAGDGRAGRLRVGFEAAGAGRCRPARCGAEVARPFTAGFAPPSAFSLPAMTREYAARRCLGVLRPTAADAEVGDMRSGWVW